MTNRERFWATINGDKTVDRCPVIEWASWWGKTLDIWYEQGLTPMDDHVNMMRQLTLDPLMQFWFPHKSPACPAPKSHGAPLITSEKEYMELRPLLLPDNAVDVFMNRIERVLPEYERGETIVWYTVEGFFWFPRELLGIENHLYSFFDEPALYHHICEDLLEWQIKTIDKFSRYIKADFCTVAEDMSYNHGSMISEELWDEFIRPYYQQLTPHIKKYGTKAFIDSDGNISKSIPWFIRSGIDGVLPLECQSGVDVNVLRQEYPDFLLIGGFDKMCMFKGETAIRAEFERITPAIRSGKYIPSMDHQTPPGTTLENYHTYVRLLKEYAQLACKA